MSGKDNLLPENHLHETEARWFAIRTGFRKEKVVNRFLKKKGIETYLPLQKLVRKYSSKVKNVELPLFTCYMFVKIVKSEYVKVLETDNVFEFIKFKRNLLAIPEKEIAITKQLLGLKDVEVTIREDAMKKGDKVQVILGSLVGIDGELIEEAGKSHVIVRLETVGVGLAVEIEKKFLKKI